MGTLIERLQNVKNIIDGLICNQSIFRIGLRQANELINQSAAIEETIRVLETV